jgi:hypothetical protein
MQKRLTGALWLQNVLSGAWALDWQPVRLRRSRVDNPAMKVLNLQCAQQHSFEGWFASEDDFQSQLSRGLIECPMCADKRVQKLPSAPRLNLGGHTSPGFIRTSLVNWLLLQIWLYRPGKVQRHPNSAARSGARTERSHVEQAEFLKALRHVLTHTEDVGSRFAEEARRMHYGELEARRYPRADKRARSCRIDG